MFEMTYSSDHYSKMKATTFAEAVDEARKQCVKFEEDLCVDIVEPTFSCLAHFKFVDGEARAHRIRKDSMMELSDAWRRGYCKYYATQTGIEEQVNPYEKDSNDWQAWNVGFKDAYFEQCRTKLEMGPAIYKFFGSVEV